jgi:hypothetical protein
MSDAAGPILARRTGSVEWTDCVLALTQVIGWATTYYVPSTLVGPLMRDLRLSSEMVFGCITLMLLVSAGPLNVLIAASSIVFAALLHRAGLAASVAFALGLAVIVIGAMLALLQVIRRQTDTSTRS